MALDAIKKWMKEHDPHKPVKPEALGKGTRKVTPTKTKKKKTDKAPAKKTASKKTKANALVPKGKVPIPAQKRDGKTAAVAKRTIKEPRTKDDKDPAPKSKGLVRDAKTGKLPSANIVPKGKQYKSAGVVKSLGILPKKSKVAVAAKEDSKPRGKGTTSKTPKFDAALRKKSKPKVKQAGLLGQLFGG